MTGPGAGPAMALKTPQATVEDTGGKILGSFFPIMAFVAIGFDHVVANMFFIPAAIFAEAPGITWGDALYNWVSARDRTGGQRPRADGREPVSTR